MTYKQFIHREMRRLSTDNRVKFIGYNTKYGHQMYGTLKGCEESCIEMPVAENLIMGLAMGMSLEGFRPIVCVERSNFLLPMADAIINHLCAMPKMSGEFTFPVIIRVVIPTSKPLDAGIQHLGDYTGIITRYTDIPAEHYGQGVYAEALESDGPSLIIEHKEEYETHYTASKLQLHRNILNATLQS